MKQRLTVIGDSTDKGFAALCEMCLNDGFNITLTKLAVDNSKPMSPGPKAAEVYTNGSGGRIVHYKKDGSVKAPKSFVRGQTTAGAIVDFLTARKGKAATREELAKEFGRIGYAPHSAAAALSFVHRHGWVAVDGQVITLIKAVTTNDVKAALKKTYKKTK